MVIHSTIYKKLCYGFPRSRFRIECHPGVVFLESTQQRSLVLTGQADKQPSTSSPRGSDETYPNQLWKIIDNETIALNSQPSTVLALPAKGASQVKILL